MSDTSIGSRLKKERESKGFSYDKIAEELRIQPKFLEALEQDDYSLIPGPTYVKAFLRTYSRYLGLNTEELLKDYKEQQGEKKDVQEKVVPLRSDEQIQLEARRELRKKLTLNFTYKTKLWILIGAGVVFLTASGLLLKSCFAAPDERKSAATGIVPDGSQLALETTASGECWFEISSDKEGVTKMMFNAGDKKTWYAKEEFNIKIGKKDNIKLVLDGKPVDLSTYKESYVGNLNLKKEEKKNAK
ncbi:MAG: RodZ domain-containing protein [Candidatus Firestonebacteria bacterium]